MAETKIKSMNHGEDKMCITADFEKEERLEEVPAETMPVRKRIGKQIFLVRVHFKEEGAENLQDKVCRMLGDEVRNGKYAGNSLF